MSVADEIAWRWTTTVDGAAVVECTPRMGFIVRMHPLGDGWRLELRGRSERQAVCGYDPHGDLFDTVEVDNLDAIPSAIDDLLETNLF